MFWEPGAMAAPISDMSEEPTRMVLRAWKVSDPNEMTGPSTAWTRESELGTQVWAAVLLRLVPM
jgi:hypothetical protein